MYSNRSQGWLKHLDFIVLDVLCLCLSLYVAYGLRHGFGSRYAAGQYVNIGIIMIVLDVMMTVIRDFFRDVIRRGYIRELIESSVHVTLVMMGLLVYLYLIRASGQYSRVTLMITWGLGCFLTTLVRSVHKLGIRKRLKQNDRQSAVMLVCTQCVLEDTFAELVSRKYRDYRIAGILITDSEHPVPDQAISLTDDTGSLVQSVKSEKNGDGSVQFSGNNEYKRVPVIYNRDDLSDFVKQHVIDEMFICLPGTSQDAAGIVSDALSMGIVVHQNLLGTSKTAGGRLIDDFAGYMVLTSGLKVTRHGDIIVKRLTDIVGAVFGLLFTAVIFPFIAIAIKMKSPGPVLFSQIRVGKGGRQFRLYKFRSMVTDAEERRDQLAEENMMSGHMFKVHNDPRIIPGVGEFIRKTSIDELPQFWNVLKGDMSLVGTRPPTVQEYEEYDMHHLARMSIKPGITGLWQVSGRNRITDFEEVVRLDRKYIEEWSLYLDLKILVKTIQVVVLGDGE